MPNHASHTKSTTARMTHTCAMLNFLRAGSWTLSGDALCSAERTKDAVSAFLRGRTSPDSRSVSSQPHSLGDEALILRSTLQLTTTGAQSPRPRSPLLWRRCSRLATLLACARQRQRSWHSRGNMKRDVAARRHWECFSFAASSIPGCEGLSLLHLTLFIKGTACTKNVQS